MGEAKQTLLLAKFGKEEHIRQLQEGKIFFNAIKTYRDDGTSYRGDSMEGKIPLDPKKIAIYDKEGNNILDKIPRPTEVIKEFGGDEELKMFCAAIINVETINDLGKNEWVLKEKFKNAVKDFGEYVLVFYSAELIENIDKVADTFESGIVYDARPILYRNFKDYEHTEEYRATGSFMDPYFVKSLKYKMQNEWRIIIDGEKESLKTNCGTGFLLQTQPLKSSTLMKTSDFFNSKLYF